MAGSFRHNHFKHIKLIKLIAALAAVLMCGAVLTACGDRSGEVSAKVIDFGAASQRGVWSYFKKAEHCKVDFVNDAQEGRVLRLRTRGVKKPTSDSPAIYFKYADFCKHIGETPLDLAETTCVVLKVKANGLHDRLFSVLGTVSTEEDGSAGTSITARVHGGDDWHYICFDFNDVRYAEQATVLRLCFEQMAGGNNESILISELRVCSREEADKLLTADTFPVETQTDGDQTLRVLQFNIQTENGNGAPFIARSEMYRQLIYDLRPDIVGMQEVTVTWRQWLDNYVFNDSYASVGESRAPGDEATPIYYRADKFDMLESGTFWLSDTPDEPATKVTDANLPRICTWARFRDKATGREFVHINTHLDHNGANDSTAANAVRKAQASVIVRYAQRFGDLPVFLTGDMNTRRTTSKGGIAAVYKLFTGSEQVVDDDGNTYTFALADTRFDAPVTVDENHTATMTKFYDKSSDKYEPTREPIDYVFYEPRAFTPLSYETFLISREGYEISDHLPVYTVFKFN